MNKQTPPPLPQTSDSHEDAKNKQTTFIAWVVLLVTLAYVATMLERAYVLYDAGYLPVPTNTAQAKYLLGLSYSAEEMKMIIKLKEMFSR